MSDLPVAKPINPDDVAAVWRNGEWVPVMPDLPLRHVDMVEGGRYVRRPYIGEAPDALAGT